MTDAVFDSDSLFARAWFAIMRNPDGTPQDVVRSALVTVLSLLNVNNDNLGEKVDRLLFAWDGPNKRDKGRSPKPPEYYETRKLLQEYLSLLFNPAHVQIGSYEADDVVGTAVAQSDANSIFVISGDKDLQQLAGESVHYYCLHTKGLLSTRSICDQRYIKHPSHLAIAMAIIGDKVDAIKGVKGWGPKKVKKLFLAATPEMTLEEAMCHVEKQMIEAGLSCETMENFYLDLDLTVLHSDLEGVPQPADIKLADPGVVEELHLPDFMHYYRSVYQDYCSQVHLDAEGDEEDVPENSVH